MHPTPALSAATRLLLWAGTPDGLPPAAEMNKFRWLFQEGAIGEEELRAFRQRIDWDEANVAEQVNDLLQEIAVLKNGPQAWAILNPDKDARRIPTRRRVSIFSQFIPMIHYRANG